MKNLKAILPLLLVTFIVKGQIISLHPIVKAAKEESYFATDVDWEVIDNRFKQLAKNYTQNDSLKPALTYLLNTLKDKHGMFRSATDYMPVAYFTAYDQITNTDNRERNPDFVNNVINNIEARFSSKLLLDNVGYLKVVGIGGQQDLIQEAQNIRAAIRQLDSKGVNSWIIDLRFNGGGNMNPMLAGLAPLLSPGVIGYSLNRNGEPFQEFKIEAGKFYDTGRLVDSTATIVPLKNSPKIAVLLSRYTVSSGELVAVAFKGQKEVRFFGEPSGGLTTATGWRQVAPNLMMCISASVFADRNQTAYPINVPVDVSIDIDINALDTNDTILKSALAWLSD